MRCRNNTSWLTVTAGVETTPAHSVQTVETTVWPSSPPRVSRQHPWLTVPGVGTTPGTSTLRTVGTTVLRLQSSQTVETTVCSRALANSCRNNSCWLPVQPSKQRLDRACCHSVGQGAGTDKQQSQPSSVGCSRQCGPSRTFKRAQPSGCFNNRRDVPSLLHARTGLWGLFCAAAVAAEEHGPVPGPYSNRRNRWFLLRSRTLSGPLVIVARLLHGGSPGRCPVLPGRNPNRIPRCTDKGDTSRNGSFTHYGKHGRAGRQPIGNRSRRRLLQS